MTSSYCGTLFVCRECHVSATSCAVILHVSVLLLLVLGLLLFVLLVSITPIHTSHIS